MVSEAQEERTLEAKAMTVKHISAFVMAGEAQSASLAQAGEARERGLEPLCELSWKRGCGS